MTLNNALFWLKARVYRGNGTGERDHGAGLTSPPPPQQIEVGRGSLQMSEKHLFSAHASLPLTLRAAGRLVFDFSQGDYFVNPDGAALLSEVRYFVALFE
jgi:hypothetical protein